MKYSTPHLHKNRFFELLQFRLSEYADALLGTQPSQLRTVMAINVHHDIAALRRIDENHDLFGREFWGYGINRISDGSKEYFHPDFSEIAQIPGLNKHHETYRNLILLIFAVKKDKLSLSLLAIDTVRGGVTSDLTEIPLKYVSNVDIKTRPTGIYMDLHVENMAKSVSFQVENLYPGGNWLTGAQLAQYYKQELEGRAALLQNSQTPASTRASTATPFLEDLLHFVRVLYDEGDTVPVIKSHRESNTKDEGGFRDYFCTLFRGLRYHAEPESKKGSKRIDLKVITPATNEKNIIEFKGWWNNKDKKMIVNQLCEYLSEFEESGYVFMINDTRSSIRDIYQKIVCSSEMKYIDDSWKVLTMPNTGFTYFSSQHGYGEQGKTLFHILFNVFPRTLTGQS